MTDRVKVVFIAGDSRSGTTLLDLALGQVPGFFSGGELRYVWRRGFEMNVLCGCGRPFRDCPHWRAVLAEFNRRSPGADPAEALRLQRLVDAPDTFLKTQAFSPRRFTRGYRDAVAAYLPILGAFYESLRAVTGCDTIVDSSKSPGHGFLLARTEAVELHVVHLVRDARAVAHSMQRRKPRPDIHWEQAYMPTYPPGKAAVRWSLTNLIDERFKRRAASYTRLRYEDFVREPKPHLRRLLVRTGADDRSTAFLRKHELHVTPNHTVSGNPARFAAGEASTTITIAPDHAWHDAMPPDQRRRVTMLALPMLWRYGYLG